MTNNCCKFIVCWQALLKHGINYVCDNFLIPNGWFAVYDRLLDQNNTIANLLVAEAVCVELNRANHLWKWLNKALGGLEPKNERLGIALKKLCVPLLTTNYDSLIEQCGRWRYSNMSLAEYNSYPSFLKGMEKVVIHIHGHLDNEGTHSLRSLTHSLAHASLTHSLTQVQSYYPSLHIESAFTMSASQRA